MVGAGLEPGDKLLDGIMRSEAFNSKVKLFGPCDEMPGFLSALDIFVSSSIGEGFSNVLAEAMCCEAPCVATDVGDSANIIGEAGLVAKPGDPENLALRMEDLVIAGSDQRAEIGRAARNRIISKWTINAVADQYLSYYQQVLK